MNLAVVAETPPLREDASGAIRVGNTRVLVELVIPAFQEGATPETIIQRYSTLALSDIYAVIAYYLRHRSEVDAYLARRLKQGDETQHRSDCHQAELAEIRSRLAARRNV